MAEVVVARTASRVDADRELRTFLLAAFAVSWVVGIGGSMALGPGAYLIGVLGPAIAALWVTRRYEGSVQSLWRHVVRWRLPIPWYLAALALPLLLLAAAYAIVSVAGESWRVEDPFPVPAAVAFLVFAIVFAGGPEEIGWRGYALPRLQCRWDALTASLVLGGIWALWHAPLWLMPDLAFRDLSFPLYSVQILAMCVVYTWLYNTSRGSVLLAMVLHGSGNLAATYLATSVAPQAVLTALWVAVAAGLVLRFGRRTLASVDAVDREEVRRLALAE